MENTIELLQTVDKKENLLGDWRLTVEITGRMGVGGFTAKLIDSYTDPVTGKPRHYYNEHGVQQAGFMIEKPIVTLHPRTSRQHAHAVDFLLGHPTVFVESEHGRLNKKYQEAKQSNPRIKLVNLDHQDLDNLEDEDTIDKLVGLISLDKGSNALSTLKLQYILAALNMTYIEDKFLMGTNAQKPKLRKRLKEFVRKGENADNAITVNRIIENLDEAKYVYQVKELLRFEIITLLDGHYKYEGHPLGVNTESVIQYFIKNPDFYGDLMTTLSNKYKEESK